MLKLQRLPRGSNRNRVLHRPTDATFVELDYASVEELFRRFWQEYRQVGGRDTLLGERGLCE